MGSSVGRALGYHAGDSGSIPSRAGNFYLLLSVHPAENGQLGLLRPGESEGGEESNGKLSQNAVLPEKLRTLTPGNPTLSTEYGLLYFNAF